MLFRLLFRILHQLLAPTVPCQRKSALGWWEPVLNILKIMPYMMTSIGDTFYIKDENTLIIPWDGVFFEVQRISSDS